MAAKEKTEETLRLLRVMERNKERQLTLQVSWWRWFGDRGLSKTSSPRKLKTENKLIPYQICELYDQNRTVRTGYGYITPSLL